MVQSFDVRMEVILVAVVFIVVYGVVIGAVLLPSIKAGIEVFLDLVSCFIEEFFTSKTLLDIVLILLANAENSSVWFLVDTEKYPFLTVEGNKSSVV